MFGQAQHDTASLKKRTPNSSTCSERQLLKDDAAFPLHIQSLYQTEIKNQRIALHHEQK